MQRSPIGGNSALVSEGRRGVCWGGMKINDAFWAGLLPGITTLLIVVAAPPCASAGIAIGSNGIVASGHPLATEAGVEVLRAGGNAVDAAVAVGLTLGVVDGHNSGIGGGCVMLIRQANGRIIAVDGREMAPLSATREMYLNNGQPDPP